MPRLCRFLLLLLLPLLATGCLTLEETLVFHRDGSGSVQLVYRMDEAQLPAFTAGLAAIAGEGQETGIFTDEGLARKQFSGDGITLKEFASYQRQGKRNVRIFCAVTDMQRALASGKFGDIVYVRREDGTYRLRLLLPEPGQPLDAAAAARLREKLKGLAVTFTIHVPGRIQEAAGAEIRGNSARWQFDAARDDAFLRATPVIEALFTGPEPRARR
ncbi:MAG: hypothetical protein WC789_07940 [Lentisphaeria bacterium]|jgi:hypothetical protein